MSIEQTAWYRTDLQHFVNLAKSLRYTVGWNEYKADVMSCYAKMRGADVAKKIFAKANQKLKAKVY